MAGDLSFICYKMLIGTCPSQMDVDRMAIMTYKCEPRYGTHEREIGMATTKQGIHSVAYECDMGDDRYGSVEQMICPGRRDVIASIHMLIVT